jgi:hypothetical protein
MRSSLIGQVIVFSTDSTLESPPISLEIKLSTNREIKIGLSINLMNVSGGGNYFVFLLQIAIIALGFQYYLGLQA